MSFWRVGASSDALHVLLIYPIASAQHATIPFYADWKTPQWADILNLLQVRPTCINIEHGLAPALSHVRQLKWRAQSPQGFKDSGRTPLQLLE
jgi:hypothetical protein